MSIISSKKIANTVMEHRKRNNMTQDQLGELTGINRAMVGRIEREDYTPTLPQLERLMDVLHFSLDEILDNTHYEVYTAFRGKNLTAEEQEGVNHLFAMMSVAKQQIMLRKALHHEE
ncbi:MAG: helix-turn-helix transcriptional regulator [Clostridiales bacterium]|nr:helix-turn-helix transcriptional regulator [Clostridiales bacterium]